MMEPFFSFRMIKREMDTLLLDMYSTTAKNIFFIDWQKEICLGSFLPAVAIRVCTLIFICTCL
jgi:hypothetical protein